MQSTPPTNPEANSSNKSSSSSRSKCKLLKMMTPIFLWSNMFPRSSQTSPGYQNAVRSISERVTDGISHLTGEIKSTFRNLKRRNNRRGFLSEDQGKEFKSGSIGSRGYEEFQEGCMEEGLLPIQLYGDIIKHKRKEVFDNWLFILECLSV